jgi:hypothetical protein
MQIITTEKREDRSVAPVATMKSNVLTREGSITFANVFAREFVLIDPLVKGFVNSLPAYLQQKCINLFLEGRARRQNGYEMSEDEAFLLGYLASVSDITRIIKETPSSARAFEYLYQQRPAKTTIDQYYVDCLAGSHVNMRMIAIWKNLPELIEDLYKKFGETVLIDNIGSGPGLELIGVLQAHPELVDKVHIRNIDPDEIIIDEGRRKVESLGIQRAFEFVPKKAHEAGVRGAHLVILVGILCTQSPKSCVKTLDGVRFFSRQNGLIVYSTNQESMVLSDPFTDMIMRLAGWFMDYKTDQQSWQLGKDAGWEPISQFFEDDMHFQCMTVARMK